MPQVVYVALGGERQISIFDLDPEIGRLARREEVALSGGPGPLCVDPTQTRLYAGLRSSRQLASFSIDRASGSLMPIGIVSSEVDACYLSTDRRGRFLLCSSYGGGAVWVQAIGADGAVQNPPVDWQATAPCAHSIQTDPTNRFAFVPHVSKSNVIFQFAFDQQTGRLTPNAVPRVVPAGMVGPRHYVFHPSLNILYCDNEQGSSVTAYRLDAQAGTLAPLQTLSTLPEGFSGDNTCAQIHLVPSGRFLYVSNRGHDSIAGFAVQPSTGELRTIGQFSTEPTPRAFHVDPAGRLLFASGQGSSRLATYRIDPQDGRLTLLDTLAVGKGPMWILPLSLEP